MDSKKFEVRSSIKFLTKLGWQGSEIIEAVHKVYGDDSLSTSKIYEWIHRFKDGRESIEDDPREGRPSTSTTDENVDAVRQLLELDRRMTVEMIAHEVDISVGSAHEILTDRLGLSKLSARWVPKGLTDDQKQQRLHCAINFLNRLDHESETFYKQIVTGDETWIYQYDPESKIQSKQWLPTGGHGPIKFKSERSVKKVMATVFWDCDGVILLDFLHDQSTITGAYYEGVLNRLREALNKKRPGKFQHRVLFHQDNAPAHRFRDVVATLRKFKWEILIHPPYSPDLAPSDFFLFPKLKEHVKGIRWDSISSAEQFVKQWFKDQGPGFYRAGLESWRHRMEKCQELEGDYVEKA